MLSGVVAPALCSGGTWCVEQARSKDPAGWNAQPRGRFLFESVFFAHYVSREKARLFYFEKLGCDLGSGKNKLHQRVKGVTPFCGYKGSLKQKRVTLEGKRGHLF